MSNNRLDPNAPPSTPRWVKILLIIFVFVVALFIVLHLMGLGLGDHGMGGHTLLKEHVLKAL